jgi:hypothetical protein
MSKFLVVIGAFTILIMSACANEPAAVYKDVEVIGNRPGGSCFRCSDRSDITLTKGNNVVTVQAYKDDAELLQVGNVVNVEVSDNGLISKVSIPNMENVEEEEE